MKIEKPTLYDLLQVTQNATPEVIRAAWKARMALEHPDKGGKEGLATKLNEAKEILLNEAKRKSYDADLRHTIGSYLILEKIAEGGLGETYKAQHLLLEELACLKRNITVSPEDTELVVREAKVLWQLHHYSLPTLRDFFKTADGRCVLAMSYVAGPSIDKIVEKKGGIDPEHVCWMTQRLLNALHYMHFHGIVHCDVKPNNIIIKPEEHNAVLVDYGFASLRPKQKTTPEGYTQVFAAPEIVALRPPIPESDFYSLGVTMIYALGGNPISKLYPKSTPTEIKGFFDQLIDENPLRRPSWEKSNLVEELVNIRKKVFGRANSNKKFEV